MTRSREAGRPVRSPRTASYDHHPAWPCDISLLDAQVVDGSRLHGARQVTDAYLIALATEHDGRFVTFGRSVSLSAIHGATEADVTVL